MLNFVQRLFDRLDDWTQSLRQAAETGEGVEELLSRASAIRPSSSDFPKDGPKTHRLPSRSPSGSATGTPARTRYPAKSCPDT